MINNDLNNYTNAVRLRKNPSIKIAQPRMKKAWETQKGKCTKCGKELKEYLCKLIGNSEVICSDCILNKSKKKN
jgi:hypothetical protein